jgi:hypothetical protein
VIKPLIRTRLYAQNDQAGISHRELAAQFVPIGQRTRRHIVLLKITDDGALRCRIVVDNKNVTSAMGLIAQPVAFRHHRLLATPFSITTK